MFIRPDSTDQSSRKEIARDRTFPKCGVTIQSDFLQQYFLHVTIWNYLFFTTVKLLLNLILAMSSTVSKKTIIHKKIIQIHKIQFW